MKTCTPILPLLLPCLSVLAQTSFTKITTGPIVSDAAHSLSAAWVDFDHDGDLDLYVTNSDGPNLLYTNDGKGVFAKVMNGSLVNVSPSSFGTSWADFDNDGRIALFLARHNASGLLFRQQTDGIFSTTTLPLSLSFGAAWADYDNDGFVDLRVDDEGRNILWHNDGHGGLAAVTDAGLGLGGSTWQDFDGDGDMDLFDAASPFGAGGNSKLYRNDGHGVFAPITGGQLGQRATLVTGVAWADYDNDGFPDLFISRGNFGQNLPSFLFHNNADGTFTQVEQSPFTVDPRFPSNCSWADYDNDGWLDLIVTESNGTKNRLYRKQRRWHFFARVLSHGARAIPERLIRFLVR